MAALLVPNRAQCPGMLIGLEPGPAGVGEREGGKRGRGKREEGGGVSEWR